MKSIILIFFCLAFGIANSQQSLIDSLEHKIQSSKKKDTNLVNLYTQLGNELIDNKQSDNALKYGEKAKLLSAKLKFVSGQLNALNVIAKYYQDTQDYTKSEAAYREYIALSKKKGRQRGVMQGSNNLGLLYFDKGDYSKALKSTFKALKIAENRKDFESIPSYYNNISRVYFANNQFEKAIEYAELALKIEEEHFASPKAIIIRSINLSAYYIDFGVPQKSVDLLMRMRIFNDTTIQHPLYEAYMCANIGNAYIILEKYDRAIEMILKAYPTFEKSDRMRGQLDLNLANSYSNIGKPGLAIKYLNNALRVAEAAEETEFKRFAFETASEVYKNRGDFKKALKYYEMAIVLKSELLGVEQSDKIVEMQTKFETRQKEDSIALQKVALQKEKVEKGKIQTISNKNASMLRISIIALVLVSALSFIAIRLYRRSEKHKTAIESKNKENELLLGEIHHRVKNNLQVISSLLALQERSISDEKAKAAIVEGRERVQSIGLIHKHLYQNNNFSSIEMKSYISNLIDGLMDTLGSADHPIKVESNLETVELDIDTAIPLGLMINELVVNAVKHAYIDVSSPVLRIVMRKNTNGIELEISDNGIGKKSDIETSDSFGMKLIRSLTRQLSASFSIEQSDGLRFKINLNPNSI